MDEILEKANLPEWLREQLLPPREAVIISFEDGKYVVYNPHVEEDEKRKAYDSIKDAYENNHELSSNMRIDDSVLKELDVEDSLFISYPSERNPKYSTMVVTTSDESRLMLLEYSYKSFLETAEKYREDPSNFRNAYSFVVDHPAFWIKPEKFQKLDKDDSSESENTKWRRNYDWKTSCDQDVWTAPLFNKDKKTGELKHCWALEIGGHITDEYLYRYHDLRLDVYADTIEEAYVILAEKVNKFFNDDGTEKENVEYEKSALELELEERVAELDADLELEDNNE